jgi:phenylacetate-CoA ligase
MMTDTDLDAGERMSLDELRADQLKNLRTTVTSVYEKVPFYRKAFDELGVTPADITSLEDIAKLPFTTKQDLRDNYPVRALRGAAGAGRTHPRLFGHHRACRRSSGTRWVTSTSGAALIARSILGAGGERGQMMHNAYGYGLFTGGLGVHGAERHGFTVVPISGGQTPRQVQLIQDFKPEIITATPTYLLTILDEFHRQGIDPTSTSLKTAICGAEPWTDEMRKEIEQSFDIDAVDIYGLSEVMGPGVACESAVTKDGPTIWEDHFYPEIVDPFTGEALPDGEEGELVFTSLTKEALPIIRYRTHDLATLLPGTARPELPPDLAHHRPLGRPHDHPRGECLPGQRRIRALRVQPAEPALPARPHPPRPDGRDDRRGRSPRGRRCDRARGPRPPRRGVRIKERLGVSCGVDIKLPGDLPRSVGKMKRIIDPPRRRPLR